MSDSDKTQGPPPGDTGDDARTPRARTRTRSRASAAGEPESTAAKAPRAAKAAADDAPVVKRVTRKRTVKPAGDATDATEATEGAQSAEGDAAEPAAKPARAPRAPAKPRAPKAPKTEAAADGPDEAQADPAEPVRRRTRTRAADAAGEAPAAPVRKPRAPKAAATDAPIEAADLEAPSDTDSGEAAEAPKPRSRSRAKAKPEEAAEAPTSADTEAADSTGTDATAAAEDDGENTGEDTGDGPAVLKRTRRGRRGGRNRNRTRRTEGDDDTDQVDTDSPGTAAAAGKAREERAERASGGRAAGDRGGRGGRADDADDADGDEAPTRLQARARRGATTAPRGRGRQPGRRPVGGVSEEVRRVIAESPPRRMLVTVGNDRTQIAVLEERTLVEHYVTRKQDVGYVGNIYLGRVQNVLPGMEAAFVDIGKGRNGVLYAGEVNYDEADLDGDLPRIEEQLKAGQTVLVQVTKDPMGTKGARLTQHLSIAGRYCVLAPGEGMLGISRKLPDEERERLRVILKAIRPEGFGLIVRTAAEGATREQLEADVSRLVRIWEQVDERAKDAKPLDTVYEEPDLVIRVIRDVFGPEYTELIVDSEELASQIRDYLSDVSPELVDRVKAHAPQQDPESGETATPDNLFDAYEVTNQIRRALEKKVWLKSGGYLIVEKTEAMWVIDVNTGKFVGERNLEATVLKNNLEAADEIARQLRLRDMGGIIVIDFVDMLVPANRDEVLKRFKRELARDKTKSRVMEISKLGLVQMTRKNVSVGLQESFTTKCEVCEGRGARIVDRIV